MGKGLVAGGRDNNRGGALIKRPRAVSFPRSHETKSKVEYKPQLALLFCGPLLAICNSG